MQTNYDASIEMWSVGCIMGELISEHKLNKKIQITRPRRALFEGKACFPLSPPKGNKDCTYKIENGFPHSEDDQMYLSFYQDLKYCSLWELHLLRKYLLSRRKWP